VLKKYGVDGVSKFKACSIRASTGFPSTPFAGKQSSSTDHTNFFLLTKKPKFLIDASFCEIIHDLSPNALSISGRLYNSV
jgi:hypothetical protein